MNEWIALILIIVSSWVSYEIGWMRGFDVGESTFRVSHSSLFKEKDDDA